MLPQVVRNYALTCGVLLLPIFIGNVIFAERLPPAISDPKIWNAIPQPLGFLENVLRLPVFALPFFMPLRVSSKRQRVGLALFVFGMLAYTASWVALNVSPQSAWSLSAAGFLAPAYTPAVWLLGIAFLARDLSWGAVCRPWFYASLSLAFLAAHISHAAIVYLQHYKPGA